jgi:hypothetical protein
MLIPNERQATEDETHEFIKFMKYVEKDYTLSKHYGTVNIMQRLLINNSKQTIEDTKLFLFGLYHQEDYPNIEISLYNNTITSSKKPYVTITPIDLSFDGIINSKETVYAYEDTDNNEMKYFTSEQDFPNLTFKYSFDITEYILNEENEKRETELFKIKATKRRGETRSGYMMYRDGRLITGKTPRKFGFKLENSPNRGKGIRFIIKIQPEHVDCADFDFKIGTNKKLTEDSFHQFNDRLKTYLETKFNKADKNKKIVKDNAVKEYINSFDTARNSITTYNSIEELNTLSGKVQSEWNTVINNWGSTKSNSNLYRSFEKFNIICEKQKQEIETQLRLKQQVAKTTQDSTATVTVTTAVAEAAPRLITLMRTAPATAPAPATATATATAAAVADPSLTNLVDIHYADGGSGPIAREMVMMESAIRAVEEPSPSLITLRRTSEALTQVDAPAPINMVETHILTQDETIEKAVFEKVMKDFDVLVNKYDIKNENGEIIIGNGLFKIIKL